MFPINTVQVFNQMKVQTAISPILTLIQYQKATMIAAKTKLLLPL